MPSKTLLEVLAEMADPRVRKGLIYPLPAVAGRGVVGDAAFCQRDIAAAVIEAGGDYVLTVEENPLETRLRSIRERRNSAKPLKSTAGSRIAASG